jgi:transcriptional regulator with XRE-family HTH domain
MIPKKLYKSLLYFYKYCYNGVIGGVKVVKLSSIIRTKRESLNLSFRDFGKLCGLSHAYIRNLEEGDPRTGKEIIPTIKSLKKLAPALDMSLEELLEETGYLSKAGDDFEPSNLKLIRGKKTYDEISNEIALATGELIEPSIYEALEKGLEKNPSPIVIDIIAKYANVHRSFFYRSNEEETLEYTRKNSPYRYKAGSDDAASCAREEDIKSFMSDPSNEEYLILARELKERKVDIESIRKIFLD